MIFLLTIILLSAVALRLRAPAFECVFASTLIAPVILFLIAPKIGVSQPLYLAVYFLTFATLAALCYFERGHFERGNGSFRPAFFSRTNLFDAAPILVFTAAFLILYKLCLIWPDFISIGERLRDYALLSSAFASPFEPSEPWMVGEKLNYYVYWYRFGHFIGTSFSLEIWDTYHVLAAFVSAFYLTAIFRIFSAYVGFSVVNAILCAVIMAWGSNIDGIGSFINDDPNWWGPSRVIQGAINEFPAWSFLLGDLHPHYFNLPLTPFFLCLALGIATSPTRHRYTIALVTALTVILPLWTFGANAWEMPAWAIMLAWGVFTSCFVLFGRWESTLPALHSLKLGDAFRFLASPRGALIILFQVILAVSLYLSARHISAGDRTLDIVMHPIARSSTLEIFSHWGLSLTILSIALPLLFPQVQVRWFAACTMLLFLITAIASQSALAILLPLLFGLIVFLLFASLGVRKLPLHDRPRAVQAFILSMPLTGISLILFPEFLFFNDEYGGEIERMNTIFKFYSAGWFFMHIGAFCFLSFAWQSLSESARSFAGGFMPPWLARVTALVFMLGFFVHTIPLRKSEALTVKPVSQGLSSIEKRFQGAAATIQRLEKLPRGIVLEAQGNAYDLTTHVGTLSGNHSYLGWANHVGLLTKKYDEVKRRENFTDQVYREPNCETKRELLNSQNIRYVVVGPFERVRYVGLDVQSFSCLREEIRAGQYAIFAPR